MIAAHPSFSTDYPPDPGTFTGWLMLEAALGHSQVDDLAEVIRLLLDPFEGDLFAERFPFCDRPSLDQAFALLDDVIRVHDSLCPEATPEAKALIPAQRLLAARGVLLHVSLANRNMAARVTAFVAGELHKARGEDFHTIAWSGHEEVMHMLRTGVLEMTVLHTSGELENARRSARMIANVLDTCGIKQGELRKNWVARPLDQQEAMLHGMACGCALHEGAAVRVRVPGVRWRAPMGSLGRFLDQPLSEPPSPDARPPSPDPEPRSPRAEPDSPDPEPRSPDARPPSPDPEPRSPNTEPRSPRAEPGSPDAEPPGSGMAA